MRILVLERDEHLAEALAIVLARRGHQVLGPAEARTPPDAVILGLPAPCWVSPRCLPASPLLVLAGEVEFGEIERWVTNRSRWGVMTKPASELRVASWLARRCAGPDRSAPRPPRRPLRPSPSTRAARGRH